MQDQLLEQFLSATDDLIKGLLLLTHKRLEGQMIWRIKPTFKVAVHHKRLDKTRFR
jgi:hypothetical protein